MEFFYWLYQIMRLKSKLNNEADNNISNKIQRYKLENFIMAVTTQIWILLKLNDSLRHLEELIFQ